MRTSLGSCARTALSSAVTSSTTATVLASGWRLTLSRTAGRPPAGTIVYCGSEPPAAGGPPGGRGGVGVDVGVLHAAPALLRRPPGRREPLRVNGRLKLAHLAARDRDGRHAREAREAWTDDVVGEVAQGRRVARVGGEAVAGDGEDGEGEPVNASNLGGRRGCGG